MPEFSQLPSALTILSAMITPAVLISACGSLILTTSQRLSRALDRARLISKMLEELSLRKEGVVFLEERRVLFEQLGNVTRRNRILQKAMATLYLSISVFVATSVAIGIVSVIGMQYSWFPILLGILGAALLFYTSLLLIVESRLALISVGEEMDFFLRLRLHYFPSGSSFNELDDIK